MMSAAVAVYLLNAIFKCFVGILQELAATENNEQLFRAQRVCQEMMDHDLGSGGAHAIDAECEHVK